LTASEAIEAPRGDCSWGPLGRRFIMLVSVPLMHDGLAAVIVPVRLRFLWRPMLKDPADEMVLETAVNGSADCLVTFNLRHLGAAAEEFGIRVAPPGAVWREVKGARYDKE
jgi:hypothetical protein